MAIVASCSSKGSNIDTSGATTTFATSPTTAPPSSVPLLVAPGNEPCPRTDGLSPQYNRFRAPPPMCIQPSHSYTATMITDAGTVTIKLLAQQAPKTVNNFYYLCGYHFYDYTVFHRVVPDFVDQGGSPDGTGSGGPGYQFADELPTGNQPYPIGTVAMANSGPNTNGSQFFIVAGSQGTALPPNYSVFGTVTSGMDAVQQINKDGAADPNPPSKLHQILRLYVTG